MLANLFDLTERRVQQLASEGVIPRAARGRYDLIGAVRGYVTFLRDQAQRAGPVMSLEAARLKKAQAESKERENLERAGALMGREEVEEVVAMVMAEIGRALSTMPNRWVERVASETGVEPRALLGPLKDETNKVRQDAAEALAALGQSEADL